MTSADRGRGRRPAEPDQPKHKIELVSNGHAWRWRCSCGTPSGRWDPTEEEALKAGQRHLERQAR